MKLSEVIKAIEDGSKSDFKNGLLKLKNCEVLRAVEVDNNYVGGLAITLDGWEEVKPPRQWSEKELMLFKLFPWANYYSKNNYGDLIFTELKPNKVGKAFDLSEESAGRFVLLSSASELEFNPTITEEESPVYIGDLKGE